MCLLNLTLIFTNNYPPPPPLASSVRFNWTYIFRSTKFAITAIYVEKYWIRKKRNVELLSRFSRFLWRNYLFFFFFCCVILTPPLVVFVFQKQLPAAVLFTTRKTTTTARPPPRIGGRTCSSGTSCSTTTTTARNQRSLPTRTICCSLCGDGDVGGTTRAATSAGYRPGSKDGDG